MSIGTTLNNQTILLAASIVGLIAVPLALWLVVTVLQLAGRVLGFHFRIPGLVLVVAAIAGLAGGSLLLDSSGVARPAQVIDKHEMVYTHPDGSWEQRLSLRVRYSTTGDPIPRFTTTSAALLDATGVHNTIELATLAPAAADFDRLHLGDSIEVRISRVGTLFSIVRPANQTTRTLIPPNILEDALAIGALVYLAYRLRKTFVGKVVLAGVIVIACSVPLVLADQNWQRNSDLSGATEHATATVGQVTRVSEVEIGDENEGTQSVPILQPYDVVELSFVPTGYSELDHRGRRGRRQGRRCAERHPRVQRGGRLSPGKSARGPHRGTDPRPLPENDAQRLPAKRDLHWPRRGIGDHRERFRQDVSDGH